MRSKHLGLSLGAWLATTISALAQTCPSGSTCGSFEAYVYGKAQVSPPLVSGLRIPAVPSAAANSTVYIDPNSFLSTIGGTISGTSPGSLTINRNSVLPPIPSGITAVPLWFVTNNAENGAVLNDAFGTPNTYMLRRANGTAASPTALLSGDMIGQFSWRGRGASQYGGTVSRIQSTALENFTDGAQGTSITLSTTPVGGTTLTGQAVVGPGLSVGTPTAPAGGMLVGDINATRVFVNGVAVGTGGGGGGTVTSLSQGSGMTLSPNPITTTGTVSCTTFSSGLAGCVPASGGGTANFLRADGAWQTPAGTGGGTVNSVGLSVPAGSILGVTGSPVTNTGTLGLTTTGTQGGLLYFSSTSQIISSSALTAGQPILGGGTSTPTTGTRSGNTTQFVTTTGTQTSGNCVTIDASGNHIAAGSPCGAGGGGGLSGMTSGQVPIANSATTADHSIATGTTGNSTIVQTDSGGRIDAGVLPGGVTSSGGAITATQWKNGQLFVGTAALTLPAATTLSALTNSGVMIQAAGGNVTLTPAGGDGINGRTVGLAITIPNGITTVCTTSGAAGVNAFTCPLGTLEKYPLSWFSGTDYTAHSVPLVRAGTAVNVTGIVCRRSAAVGGTATIDLYAVSAGQIPPGAGTKINNTSCDANGTAGTEQALTLTSSSVPAGSWIEVVFSGAGWATNAGSGAIQVSVMSN